MAMGQGKVLLLLLTVLVSLAAIEIPLRLGEPTCAAIMSSFDPILLDIRFPAVQGSPEGENFTLSITAISNDEIAFEAALPQGTNFRKSIELTRNVVFELCINFPAQSVEGTVVYVPFTQAEDFEGLINHIEVPEQLAKEDNLKAIYSTAKKLEAVGGAIAVHQARERKLEDEIVARNIHKTQRIMTLSFVECLVIVLSGVYQVCALRKFLIEKNLY